MDAASKVCAWEFAPSSKIARRSDLMRIVENVDISALEYLFSTGCVKPPVPGAKPEPCPLFGCLADVVDSSKGETLLHRLYINGTVSNTRSSEEVQRAAALLVQRGGVLPSARDLLGRTPLHTLVLSPWSNTPGPGLRGLVEGLLQLGADAEACDAGGVRASTLLMKRINDGQGKLAQKQKTFEQTSAVLNEHGSAENKYSAMEHQAAVAERTRLAAVQSEQLAAMLLLTGQAGQGGAGGGGGSLQQLLGSPITAYPGILSPLSRAPLPYAVLVVAGDAALLPRSEVRTLLLPGCDSREKMLGALEGCCDPAQGYRAACALGPFEGPHGLATARALATAWKRAALQASQVAGEGEGGGRALGCLARCHSFVAAAGGGEQGPQQHDAASASGSSSSSSSSSSEGCPFPGECEFTALAVAHALWKDKAPKRYQGAGEKWKLWHGLAKEVLAAGGGAPAAVTTVRGEEVSTLPALAPLLTPFGELLHKHGRRDFPAPAAPPPAEDIATAGLTEDLRAPCLGLGSPSRPIPKALGGGGRADKGGESDREGGALSALVEATKRLHF